MPQHELRSDRLVVEIESDTTRLEADYGPRFDRSAQVTRIATSARSWLSAPGLAGEFGLWGHGVLGYDEASAGKGEFLKLGVGVLRKEIDEPYQLGRRWPVVRGAKTDVEAKPDQIGTRQRVNWNGWAYDFRKRYTVAQGGEFKIDYALKNTGEREIPFEHYNHNFFAVARAAAPGGSVTIETNFEQPAPPVSSKWIPNDKGVALTAATIPLRQPSWSWELAGAVKSSRVRMQWSDRTAVTICGDFPPTAFALWAREEHVCPEIFYRQLLPPGGGASWSLAYHFEES
ncbi:MAG: hypothetical protein SynsKO_38440 [Synoicihabitans sp.]